MSPASKDNLYNDMPRRVLVVTGMSGAGKSSALRALEDSGFETVDNLPLALLSAVVVAGESPLAVGIDVRTRDFDAAELLKHLDNLRQRSGLPIGIVFVDCESDILGLRYTESRRPHPLADDLPVTVGIDTERQLLAPLRENAELLIDTTRLSVADMKRIIRGQYGDVGARPLRVFLTSFGYRYGLPRDADLVFDVRFLRNPHYIPALKPQTGIDAAVAAYIEQDAALAPFIENLTRLLGPLLPLYEAEGKSYLTIAVGCTGGQHRSVYMIERLKTWLDGRNVSCEVRHRDADFNRAAAK
jgi:UPF0042 nucleotide-binding protein